MRGRLLRIHPILVAVSSSRSAAHLILASVTGFIVLEVLAMRLYPGGTWWDRTTEGHRFWLNFLCDLESRVSLNGDPNTVGSRVAQAAMLLMVLGLLPFWWIVPRLFPGFPRLGSAVRALGLASLGGIVAVVLMPSSRFGALHGAAVFVAGAPGLTAAVMAVAGLARAEARPRIAAGLGAGMLLFAVADFVLYAHTMLCGGPGPILLPIAQKLALLLLLAWIVVVAQRAAGLSVESRKSTMLGP
jgi:hypothetical protein